jgi:hypothetical protein
MALPCRQLFDGGETPALVNFIAEIVLPRG